MYIGRARFFYSAHGRGGFYVTKVPTMILKIWKQGHGRNHKSSICGVQTGRIGFQINSQRWGGAKPPTF